MVVTGFRGGWCGTRPCTNPASMRARTLGYAALTHPHPCGACMPQGWRHGAPPCTVCAQVVVPAAASTPHTTHAANADTAHCVIVDCACKRDACARLLTYLVIGVNVPGLLGCAHPSRSCASVGWCCSQRSLPSSGQSHVLQSPSRLLVGCGAELCLLTAVPCRAPLAAMSGAVLCTSSRLCLGSRSVCRADTPHLEQRTGSVLISSAERRICLARFDLQRRRPRCCLCCDAAVSVVGHRRAGNVLWLSDVAVSLRHHHII